MKLSIILPTFNSEDLIYPCLKSIFDQDFPKEDFEVLVLDGFSTDKTVEIAKQFPVKIIQKKTVSEEPRRIIGLNMAKGDILFFPDTDNFLTERNWIKRMLAPFKDKEIDFVEPLYYSTKKKYPLRIRYHILIGGDDPIAMYLGLYNRWSYITNNWTGFPYVWKDQGDYYKVWLNDNQRVPAMGSNGFCVRREIIKSIVKDKFIHNDVMHEMINKGHKCFAKVKIGIIHYQPKFFNSKLKRMKKRAGKEIVVQHNYGLTNWDMIKVFLRIALILPVFYDTVKGFIRKPESAWIFHPIACFGLLGIYTYYTSIKMIRDLFK